MAYRVRCPACGHTADVPEWDVNAWLNNRERRFRCTNCGRRDGKVERVETPSKSGMVVGSGKKGKYDNLVYHKPGCSWAGKLSWREMVEFRSWKQAEFHGYSPCKVCKPPRT